MDVKVLFFLCSFYRYATVKKIMVVSIQITYDKHVKTFERTIIMSQEKILLVCSAGMSTSLLVTKMKDYINASGLDYEVNAVASSEALDYAVENKVNVILLGPQVRFMEGQFKKALAEYNIPIDLISPVNYGSMNGANVVKQAQELMSK